MSGYYNYDSEPDDREVAGSGGSGLRSQLEEALTELRELKAERRQAAAADALRSKGIDPALVALIPKDADPNAWADQYATLTGGGRSTAAGAEEAVSEREEEPQEPEVQGPPPPATGDPVVNEQVEREREAREAMLAAQQSGQLPETVINSQMEQLKGVKSEAEFLALIREAQAAQENPVAY